MNKDKMIEILENKLDRLCDHPVDYVVLIKIKPDLDDNFSEGEVDFKKCLYCGMEDYQIIYESANRLKQKAPLMVITREEYDKYQMNEHLSIDRIIELMARFKQ